MESTVRLVHNLFGPFGIAVAALMLFTVGLPMTVHNANAADAKEKSMEQHLRAIDLALEGKWDESHKIVQGLDDKTAAWIHAVLHKIEGDLDNARYWYRRAGKGEHEKMESKAELRMIREQIEKDKA